MTRRRWFKVSAGALGALWLPPANAERRGEVYYLRRKYNFATRRYYPELYRQLSAAPFVHTLPVQLLIEKPAEARERAQEYDEALYQRILRHALNPPSLPPAEDVLAPSWPRLAWKVSLAMEWTHVLHDQLIDILADHRVKDKKTAIDGALAYYLNDPLAVTDKPLTVEFMSAFPYSHEFHHAYPRCMGIMMAYHWLQGAQYEAMLAPAAERRRVVEEALARFRELLRSPPDHFPLTHRAAPTFHELAPEAGYIFDNLHMLHHLAQDILLTEKVRGKRAELYRLLRLFLKRSASPEWFASGPQEEPLMPGAVGHRHHAGVNS